MSQHTLGHCETVLIGQASEVYEKTGKMPKKIADERDELLAACNDALETNNRDMQHILDNGRLRAVLQEAIANATGKEQV